MSFHRNPQCRARMRRKSSSPQSPAGRKGPRRGTAHTALSDPCRSRWCRRRKGHTALGRSSAHSLRGCMAGRTRWQWRSRSGTRGGSRLPGERGREREATSDPKATPLSIFVSEHTPWQKVPSPPRPAAHVHDSGPVEASAAALPYSQTLGLESIVLVWVRTRQTEFALTEHRDTQT